MKNEQILLLAGGGLLAWYFLVYKPQHEAVVPQIAPGENPQQLLPNSPVAVPGNVPLVNTVQQPPALSIPGANIASATGQNPNATIMQEQTIFNWIKWMGAADQTTFFANWQYMTKDEVNSLLSWAAGNPGGTPWNAWRTKYRIDI